MPAPGANAAAGNRTSHRCTSWSTASTRQTHAGSVFSWSANSSEYSRWNAPDVEKIWSRAARFISHVIARTPAEDPDAPREFSQEFSNAPPVSSRASRAATRRCSRSSHLRLFWNRRVICDESRATSSAPTWSRSAPSSEARSEFSNGSDSEARSSDASSNAPSDRADACSTLTRAPASFRSETSRSRVERRAAAENRASAVSATVFKLSPPPPRPPRRSRSPVNSSAASWTAREAPLGTSQDATTSPRGYPFCAGKRASGQGPRVGGRSALSIFISREESFSNREKTTKTRPSFERLSHAGASRADRGGAFDRSRDEGSARDGESTRAGSVESRRESSRAPRNAASSAIRVLGSRAWGANSNTRSFFVPAVPRPRRSRLVGGEGARASPRERTSNISTMDTLVSSSMRRRSVTTVPPSSTSRARSVPGTSRASFARARVSANARASSRSSCPIARRRGCVLSRIDRPSARPSDTGETRVRLRK